MILMQIQEEIKRAMFSGDNVKRDTLRAVVSSVKLKEKELKRELVDEEVVEVLNKHLRTIRESIEAYNLAGRLDLLEVEEKSANSIKLFLPEQLEVSEVRELVRLTIRDLELDTTNIGMVMKEIMPMFKGKADGKMVSRVIKEICNEK